MTGDTINPFWVAEVTDDNARACFVQKKRLFSNVGDFGKLLYFF